MPNEDRIYQAYKGLMGEAFGKQTRSRIHWIMDQAQEYSKWLDVGCSQGITSLLLAERDKKVVGIDIRQESVEFANSLLEGEYAVAKGNVRFICADFNTWQTDEKYEGIIMTEVLEHLDDPSQFLRKAAGLLGQEGKLIITVPFGVNNHPDHRSSYYMNGIYTLVNRFFKVQDMLLSGRWMGVIAYPKDSVQPAFLLDEAGMLKQEENFLIIDRDLTSRIEVLNKSNEQCNTKYKEVLRNHDACKEQIGKLNNQNNELLSSIQMLEEQTQKLQMLNAQYVDELVQNVEDYDDVIDLLQDLKKFILRLETQNDYLSRENETYQRKLARIFDTWYGRIAIKGYRWLVKIRARLKKMMK